MSPFIFEEEKKTIYITGQVPKLHWNNKFQVNQSGYKDSFYVT